MALITNGGRFVGVNRLLGSSAAAGTIYGNFNALRSNFDKTGVFRNFVSGEHAVSGVTDQTAVPQGYSHPGAWFMPIKAGGMASYNNLTGSGAIAASALAVKLAEAGLTGTGDLEAIGSLIVQALADISGSGEISDANLQAFLAAVANLTGSGTAAGTRIGLGALISALVGDGTATGSTATGRGQLDADIVVTGTGLSTANVGQAVWSAIAAANNVTGTMGEKLNDAGSASNPWTEIIESGLSAAEILRIVAATLAGEVSGAGSGTETFKGLDGSTDRIISTVDIDGNRTTVVVDGS